MEMKYQLEPRDYEWLTIFVHRGTLAGVLIRFLPWFGVLLALGIGVKLFDPARPVITIGTPVLFLAFLAHFWSRRHVGVRKRGAALFAPCTLTTSPEGITSAAPGRSGTTAWSALQGYGETPRHFFLMLDGVSGFIVPKRSLSREQLASFSSELAVYSRPVAKESSAGGLSLFRAALLVFALLVLIFLGWFAARGQQRSHGAAQQGDEADEASAGAPSRP